MAATSPARPTLIPQPAPRRPAASALGTAVPSGKRSPRSPQAVADVTRLACASLIDSLQRVLQQSDQVLHSAKSRLEQGEREEIASISHAARRMLSTAKNLHHCAQIAGASDTDPVDCNALVAQIAAGLEDMVWETGASVTWSGLPRLRSAKNALGLVFRELIVNAVNYRSADLPDIRIDATRLEDGWLFSVSDNGIGIAPSQREVIFEPFYRVDSRSWRPGLGLVVARAAVEHLGGDIWVEDNERGGSTFRFTLPVAGAL